MGLCIKYVDDLYQSTQSKGSKNLKLALQDFVTKKQKIIKCKKKKKEKKYK